MLATGAIAGRGVVYDDDGDTTLYKESGAFMTTELTYTTQEQGGPTRSPGGTESEREKEAGALNISIGAVSYQRRDRCVCNMVLLHTHTRAHLSPALNSKRVCSSLCHTVSLLHDTCGAVNVYT